MVHKSILITGASGFVGHEVVNYYLQYTDYNIIALVRNNYAGGMWRLQDIGALDNPRVKVLWKDLRDAFTVFEKYEIGKVAYILHLASASHVDRSIQNPREFVLDNVLGTVNLLEFMRLYNSDARMIYFSTDEVFGPAAPDVNYSEWDRYNSSNPYAATKAGAEELCLAFANTYNLKIAITHTMNIVGKRQHPEKLLPFCIREVLEGNILRLHSNKDRTDAPTRFFIHTDQVCQALDFVLCHMKKGEKYNIVGQKEMSSLQIAQMVAYALNKPLEYELTADNLRPGHDPRYALDGNKLRCLGFQFSDNFEDLLEDTVYWYEQNQKYLQAV